MREYEPGSGPVPGGDARGGGAFYHASFRSGSRAGGACARASHDYITREHEYADPDHDAALYTESGQMPAWADEDARVYWDAADSQWYAEPKRLEALGYLSSRKEPGRTRPRTHYTLTDKGRDALADWMQEPARFPRIQHEAIARCSPLTSSARRQCSTASGRCARRSPTSPPDSTPPRPSPPRSPAASTTCCSTTAWRAASVKAHTEWLDEVEQELG